MDIVSEIMNSDERILVVRNTQNMGAGMSRRTGISCAKGEFVLLVDADDYISESLIESLVTRQAETGADITCAGITILHENGAVDTKTYGDKISEGIQKFIDYTNGDIIFLNNKLVRRSLYDIVQYSGRRFIEDTPTILPLMYYANKLAYVSDPGYYYLQREGSLCHSGEKKDKTLRDCIFKALCSKDMIIFFSDKGDEYKNLISVPEFFQYIKTIQAVNPTKEDLEPYMNEFIELMMYIIGLIQLQRNV